MRCPPRNLLAPFPQQLRSARCERPVTRAGALLGLRAAVLDQRSTWARTVVCRNSAMTDGRTPVCRSRLSRNPKTAIELPPRSKKFTSVGTSVCAIVKVSAQAAVT